MHGSEGGPPQQCGGPTRLGDDALRGAPVDPGDGVQQVDLSGERGDQPINLGREVLDRLVQKVELGQDLFHDQPMVGHEAALQCPTQQGNLRTQPAAGQLGKNLRVTRARNQRHQHVAPGFAQNVGGHRGQLDARVLEHLIQPLDLPAPLIDLGLAVTGQIPQLANRLGRHKRGPHQSVLHQLADPLRILHIGFASRHVAQVPSIQQPALDLVFEHIKHRLPIHAGRLHADQRHTHRHQPVAQPHQIDRHRLKRARCLLAPTSRPWRSYTRHHGVLVDIQASTPLDHNVHGFLPGPPFRRRKTRAAREEPPSCRILTLVLAATVRCSRGSRVRLNDGLSHTTEIPTSPERPTHNFHALCAAPPGARVTKWKYPAGRRPA
jgi:hypothetical protein